MSAYRDERTKQWRYRRLVTLADGSKQRISGTPEINTKVAAEMAEREHIARLLSPGPEPKEVPTFAKFTEDFLTYAENNNCSSEVETKRQILRQHLTPFFGSSKLDAIGAQSIERFKKQQKDAGLSPKTINNQLIVLRKLLGLAHEYGCLPSVPKFNWLEVPEADFDFLDFEEADALERAAEGVWKVMITVARHTGLRQSELIGLHWDDINFRTGLLVVRRAVVRGKVEPPKNGKSREVPLNRMAVDVLKQLPRGGVVVFAGEDGSYLTKGRCKWPLWRACKRAELRRIGWHVLRHTFASHLVMRGAPLKAVQELLGHASLEMTMRYAHLSPDVRRDAVGLLETVPTSCQQNRSASGSI